MNVKITILLLIISRILNVLPKPNVSSNCLFHIHAHHIHKLVGVAHDFYDDSNIPVWPAQLVHS